MLSVLGADKVMNENLIVNRCVISAHTQILGIPIDTASPEVVPMGTCRVNVFGL